MKATPFEQNSSNLGSSEPLIARKKRECLRRWFGIAVLFSLLIPLPGRGQVIGAENDPTQGEGPLEDFLAEPQFSRETLFGEKGKETKGGRNIVTAPDGTVLAFAGSAVRRSEDGGAAWGEPIVIGEEAGLGNAIVDEVIGEILLVQPRSHRWISADAGRTWRREPITVRPNAMGHGASGNGDIGVAAMQPGITLMFGEHRGRLIMPVRWRLSNRLRHRPYHYNAAIYSDDRGKTWQTTAPFPVLGSGEAALAEISDGRILYSSRAHMSRGNRFFAWSHDGGERWLDFWRSGVLPDGPRGSSYGCMGGLIRLPVSGRDILLYSNLDTAGGSMPSPARAGASTAEGRERITVWVSFDGGISWPAKRLVFDGPSAYSSLAWGRPGTPSEGRIYLSFEGGEEGIYSGVQVAVFNLSWLLDGERTGDGEVPEPLSRLR